MIGTSLLVGISAVTICSFIRTRVNSIYSEVAEFLFPFGSMLTILVAIMLGAFNFSITLDIAAHQELGATLDRARTNAVSELELAAIQQVVARSNMKIKRLQVSYKYWKPFIPASVLEVESIQ